MCFASNVFYIFIIFTSACGLSPFHLREFLFSPNLPCMYAISDVEAIWLLDEMFYLFNNYMLKKQPNVTQYGFLFVFIGFPFAVAFLKIL